MPFPTKGESHEIGVQNEKDIGDKLVGLSTKKMRKQLPQTTTVQQKSTNFQLRITPKKERRLTIKIPPKMFQNP